MNLEDNVEEKLIEILHQFETLPFLFIGSGISRRYIDLENWEQLLTKYAKLIGKPFSFYRSSANGDYAKAGSLIAEDFHDYWYKIATPEQMIRNEKILLHQSSPLKIEISNYLKEKSLQTVNDSQLNEELELLKSSTIDGIITTNYDALIDNLFSDYKVYIGQDELLNSAPQMIAEIYKIHGSCLSPNSLVLTSEDYEEFSENKPYLTAKLLTIFIEHPIIFLGYSLNDKNIRNILDSVISCLNAENLKKLEKQLIFIEWDREKKGNKIYSYYSTSGGRSIPITIIRTDDFSCIFRALGLLERRLSPKMYRLFKEQLYEIVAKNDPQDKLDVNFVEITDEEKMKTVRFAIGFGKDPSVPSIGYDSINVTHLFQNLIFNDLKCDPEKILKFTLPSVLRGRKYVPIFKFLRQANYLSETGTLNGDLDPKIIDLVLQISNNENYFDNKPFSSSKEGFRNYFVDIKTFVEEFGADSALYYIPFLEENKINVDDLEEFLKIYFDDFEINGTPGKRSFYRKVASLYDWLKFGVKITSVKTEK